MAVGFANMNTGFAWRCVAVACALALLTYGHGVLSDTRVFGFYTALCLFAVAIVFYQTSSKLDGLSSTNGIAQLNRSNANKQMRQLSTELAILEEEYKTDLIRLEAKWL